MRRRYAFAFGLHTGELFGAVVYRRIFFVIFGVGVLFDFVWYIKPKTLVVWINSESTASKFSQKR